MVKNLIIQSAKIHIIFELAEYFVDCGTVLPSNARVEYNNEMIVRIVLKKPRRGLISITPYKKISDFRSVGIGNNPIGASRRDAIS